MKINKPKIINKPFVLISALLIVGLAGYVAFAYSNNVIPFGNQDDQTEGGIKDGVNYSTPTDEQRQAGENQKKETINPATLDNNSEDEALNVTITAFNQNGDMVQIRNIVDKVSVNGKCTLTLTKNNDIITKSSNIQALPAGSTCQGFDVLVSDLSSGVWTATVLVEIEDMSGSATREFTI